jgi:short-subunit dehydrogenase
VKDPQPRRSSSGLSWIIGASTGIGADLAHTIAQNEPSTQLLLSARSVDKLNDVASQIRNDTAATSHVLPFDMSGAVPTEALQDQLAESNVYLNRVVINAGVCEYLDSNDLDIGAAENVMATNYLGPMKIVRTVLPMLREASSHGLRPSLVFVSSSVTYQSLPRAHAYGASKAAMRYFVECLKADLQKEGIHVQIVSPGFVDTPLTQVNDFPMPFLISSKEAAEKIYRGMQTSVFDISFPKPFVWSLKAFASLPTRLKFKLLGKMSRHEAPNKEKQMKNLGSESS